MSFIIAGSLHSYTKSMKMQMKWEQKQSKSDYSSDGTTSIAEQLRKEASGIGTVRRSDAAVMNGIRAKLNAGKRLSSSELEYLKKNDPETYQHVKSMEMERKAYEQRLKNCKTKEEVQRLKASQMASSLDKVREIDNNPNISSGEKLKLIMQEHQKVSSVTDATVQFSESGEYQKLPTEAEKRKAEKDLKEAKEAEMRGETADGKDKTVDEEGETANGENTKTQSGEAAEKSVDSSEAKPAANAETDAAKWAKADTAKAREILFASRKTIIEAELTPEAQKVRRSKARVAYTQTMYTQESSATLDVLQ